jgi:hypothetical protein
VEALTRGPVHEAFATPTATDPKPSPVVGKRPPADIDEDPPEFRPEGSVWISGYWEWDAELADFIWISGLWRVPPPEMRWVPPYWTEVDGGWQRVAGFWVSAKAGEIEYRPTPPDSLEVGPTTPAPAENYFYIPGTWNYYDSGFRWRTGYWSPYRSEWIWCPARWVWTPAGCVYQPGFWDHRPHVRGQLFAPLAFSSQIYLQPGWRYRPWCVVDTNRFFIHLWIGPRSNCYYFGNYYGTLGSRWGLTPWCDWNYRRRGCYDSLWSWSNVHYRRQGIDYIGRVKGWHDHCERNDHDRPPRTWNDQARLLADAKIDGHKSQRILAADLKDVAKRDDLPIRLSRLDDQDRERIRTVSAENRKLHSERLKVEREARIAQSGHESEREARTGRDKPAGDDKPADKPSASEQISRRVQELKEQSSKGHSDARKTARLKLPELTDAAREAARGGRSALSSREAAAREDSAAASRDALVGDRLPRTSSKRNSDDVKQAANGNTGRGNSSSTGANNSGGDLTQRPARTSSGREADQDHSQRTIRSNTAASKATSASGKSDAQIESSRTNSPNLGGSRGADDSPRNISQPRLERSQSSLPRIESTPKTSAPQIETRNYRSGDSSIRGQQSRIESSKSSSPQPSAPKIEARRFEPSSSRSSGSSSPSQPRVMQERSSTQRVESSRSVAPRVQTQRSNSSSQSMSSRPSGGSSGGGSSASRSMSSRPSGSHSSGGSSRSSGSSSRGRNRN